MQEKKIICQRGLVVGKVNMQNLQISSQQTLKMKNVMLLQPFITKY